MSIGKIIYYLCVKCSAAKVVKRTVPLTPRVQIVKGLSLSQSVLIVFKRDGMCSGRRADKLLPAPGEGIPAIGNRNTGGRFFCVPFCLASMLAFT